MAERRMFSKAIIGSARFLRMPPSSRLLYYDLGMYADDDGVVEAFAVMRQTGATEDDLRVLVSKGFVKVLNEDLVSLIMDWNVNNTIRKDRYHPSIYQELTLQLTDGNQVTTNRQPSDNQCETEVRLGKDSIDKVSIDNTYRGKTKRFTPPAKQDVQAYIEEKGYNVDAERFIDYYTSNGWRVGKNPMKDWKAAVRTWARNNHGTYNGTGSSKRSSISGSIRPREGDPDYYSFGQYPETPNYWGAERCEDNA